MTYTSDVLIVGAGVGGLSLGLRLARKGYRVRILQQRESASLQSRPEMLQPAALQAFADLGLLDDLTARRVCQAEVFHFYRIGGPKLCEVDYRSLRHPYPYAVIGFPHHARQVLLNGLKAFPDVRIHWKTQFSDTLRRGTQVIGVRAVEDGQERDYYASVTIGSDGTASHVRESLGIRAQVTRYRNGFFGMVIKRPSCGLQEFDGQVHYYVGRGEILGVFPCTPSSLCLLVMVPTRWLPALSEESLAGLRQWIATVEPRIKEAVENVVAFESLSRLSPVKVCAGTWVADGAALMGDAAHVCHPHVAQGTFQAMEDGKVLTDVLDQCFRRGEFSAQALAPYEQARRPVVERLQRIADEYVWLWETGNPLLAWLRDRIFRTIGSKPALLQKVAATEAGINVSCWSVMERLQALGICP